MGEAAEMLLDGTLCEGCGDFLDGESPGYPRRCPACSGELRKPRRRKAKKRKNNGSL